MLDIIPLDLGYALCCVAALELAAAAGSARYLRTCWFDYASCKSAVIGSTSADL